MGAQGSGHFRYWTARRAYGLDDVLSLKYRLEYGFRVQGPGFRVWLRIGHHLATAATASDATSSPTPSLNCPFATMQDAAFSYVWLKVEVSSPSVSATECPIPSPFPSAALPPLSFPRSTLAVLVVCMYLTKNKFQGYESMSDLHPHQWQFSTRSHAHAYHGKRAEGLVARHSLAYPRGRYMTSPGLKIQS
jgi:hypothetical protein